MAKLIGKYFCPRVYLLVLVMLFQTMACSAARDGMPPEILQKILGHADYSTTANIYVHTDIEELIKSVEQ